MRVLWISTLGKRVLALPHYIENSGDEDLVILEMFSASEFLDVSLKYWITHGQVLHNLTDLKLLGYPRTRRQCSCEGRLGENPTTKCESRNAD